MASDIFAIAEQHRARLIQKERAAAAQMIRAYAGAYRRLKARIDRLTDKMIAARAKGETIGPAWLAQEQRYNELLAQIVRELGKFAAMAARTITAEQRQFVEQAQTDARDQLAAVLDGYPREVVAAFNRLPTGTVESLVGALGDGSPLRDLLAQLPGDGRQQVSDALIEGVSLGESPAQMAARMRKALGGQLDRALRIARTESLRAYRESTRRTYQENPDLVSGWRWLCAMTPSSCAACVAMHGSFHTLEERLDGHPNCRCAMVPEVRLEGVPRPQFKDPQAWLEAQTTTSQELVLGSERAREAWQAGEVRLEQFVGRKFDGRWGTHRHRLSLANAQRNENPPIGNAVPPSAIGPRGTPLREIYTVIDYDGDPQQ